MKSRPKPRKKTASQRRVAPQELGQIDAYWRAANYLSVGQIYLYDNPLLNKSALAHRWLASLNPR